ncbi:MAG: tRNA pseudouridine(54/55) synthase Pus10 [Desulfurococcaceae archaeon]
MSSEIKNSIDLDRVLQLVKKYPLCNHCLGRVFAKHGLGLGNDERGFAIKTILQMYVYSKLMNNELSIEDLKIIASNAGDPLTRLYEKITGEKISVKECFICRNKLSRKYFEDLATRIGFDLVKNNASSFVIGVSISNETVFRELDVYREIGLETSESIKNELKREIGKIVSNVYGLKTDFKNPDVMVIIDFETNSYRLIINPILLEGRYWKRGRGISQNPWFSKNGTRRYPVSIQEYLEHRLIELFKTSNIVIHASGREDVDARMLGNGRPIIIEIKNPVIRGIDLNTINSVLKTSLLEVRLDSLSSRSRVKYFKNKYSRMAKVYRLLVYSEREIRLEELSLLEEYFKNTIVKQQTPTRVLRRREDIVRTRRVYEVKNRYIDSHLFETIIYCDGGLYVKELIHGDNGRTKPSFAELIGSKLYPIEIDVISIQY